MNILPEQKSRQSVSRLRGRIAKDFGNRRVQWPDGRFEEIILDDDIRLICFESDGILRNQLRRSGSGPLLEFNFGHRCRAHIGVEGGEEFLLRSTMQLSSGQRPTFPRLTIGGEDYYIIGRVAEGIGPALLEFYAATGDWESETTDEEKVSGDLGSAVIGARSACVVIPKHWPVAKRAAAWLTKSGYRSVTAINCRPDFYVTRAGKNYVVEVKPDATLQSAALALGQLTIYGEKLNCLGKIAVFPHKYRDEPLTRLDRYDSSIEVVYV